MSARENGNVIPLQIRPRDPMTGREMVDYLAGLKIAIALGLREHPVVVAFPSPARAEEHPA